MDPSSNLHELLAVPDNGDESKKDRNVKNRYLQQEICLFLFVKRAKIVTKKEEIEIVTLTLAIFYRLTLSS